MYTDKTDYNLMTHEKEIIKGCLKKHKGNVQCASKELGLSRSTLYKKLETHAIELRAIRQQFF